jgi:hypothetical protein
MVSPSNKVQIVKIIRKHLGENGKTFITRNKNNEGFLFLFFFWVQVHLRDT